MSLVWTLIAGFLYAEIFIVLLLVLPIASPQKWQRFFRSRFLTMIGRQAQLYFYMALAILVLFLLDAIREMTKYSHSGTFNRCYLIKMVYLIQALYCHHNSLALADPTSEAHLNVGMQHNMRLFRSQRNFYISGFAIFLVLVIRRLVTLISAYATVMAQSEAAMKQAQSATNTARNLMNVAPESQPKGKGDAKVEAAQAEKVKDLEARIADLENELKRELKDKEAVKSQAESLNREYDRLTEEYSKLERKVSQTTKAD